MPAPPDDTPPETPPLWSNGVGPSSMPALVPGIPTAPATEPGGLPLGPATLPPFAPPTLAADAVPVDPPTVPMIVDPSEPIFRSQTSVQKSLRTFSKPPASWLGIAGFQATALQGRLYLGWNSRTMRARGSSRSLSTTLPEPRPAAIHSGLDSNGYHSMHLSCEICAFILTSRNERLRCVVGGAAALE
ncbi:hypothetical protein PINS_up015044 [Pythium insidiosum]|nr:hypothetical protein PINS_up015044 [Pythium insidiosum]